MKSLSRAKLVVLVAAVAVCAAAGGWVFRDARAHGMPPRKALRWAVLASQEWPLFLILYRRRRARFARSGS